LHSDVSVAQMRYISLRSSLYIPADVGACEGEFRLRTIPERGRRDVDASLDGGDGE